VPGSLGARQLGLATRQLGLVTRQLGLATRQLGLATRQLGLATRQLGLATRQLGLATRQLGLATRQLGLATRQLGLATRQLGLAAKMVALVGTALLLTASSTVVGSRASPNAPAGAGRPGPAGVAAPGRGDAGAARVTITPRDGAVEVRPDLGVVVKVANGTLGDVVMSSKQGNRVPGAFSPDRTSWHTLWTLAPGGSYTVRATATGRNRRTATASSSFTTLQPSQTIAVSDVTPRPEETVGIGMPIVVSFDRPVRNKDQVERSLELRSPRAVQGAWRWVSDQQVIFRTRKYWQPHQRITFTAHLAGVRAAKDVYGIQDHTLRFRIGDANVSRVDVQNHRMVVARNGKRVRNVGISAGRGGSWMFTTTNGVHAVMGKASPVVMTSKWMGVTDPADPRYYKLTVFEAVQISSSGEYVHSAPWSVWAQGSANVSHGCVNASPEFAAWFYGISQRGDIVTVTGTDRELEWNNGYGYWQLPWKQWLQGSALKRPVTTTPTQPAKVASHPAGHTPRPS
jgi:lipoprotein-anchoring transpeptidase ErfK/SrfK